MILTPFPAFVPSTHAGRFCDAVHHGHQKGIIHRDLKPSNILVDAQGQVKIIDFGVARATDSDLAVTTLQTDIGQLIGTLQYMSPEQCEADPHDIDTRSDIYTLGVVLYELLSSKLPYTVSSTRIFDGTRVIREQQPTKLTTIDKTLKGDIETVVFKALEKDRERRYQSSLDLAQDIRRYLSGEAIIARPSSLVYQVRIFARRNKTLVASVAMVFFVLATGVVVSTASYLRAERALVEAAQQRDAAETARAAEQEQRQLAEVNATRAAQEAAKARTEARKAEQVVAFLQDMLELAAPDAARGHNMTVREMLDEAAQTVQTQLADEPEVQAAVRVTIGQTYYALGLSAAALPHIKWVVGFRQRELGEEHPDTLDIMRWLASSFSEAGQLDEAEKVAERALEIARRALGEDHRATIDALDVLGNILMRQGRESEAEPLHVKALQWRRRVFGEVHLETAMASANLAAVFRAQHKYAQAEPLLLRAVEIRSRHWGKEHRSTIRVLNELGEAYLGQGKLERAERLLRDTLEVSRRGLGENHPETLSTLNYLGNVLFEMGDYDAAELAYRESLAMRRKLLGDEHPDTLLSMHNLVNVLRSQGKLDEARPYVTELIAHRKRVAETSDADPNALNEYARLLLTCEPGDLRDPAAALQVAQRAVEISEAQNPNILDTLALAQKMTGDLDRAIETQRRAVALLPPAEWRRRTEFETRLADLLVEAGRFAEAEPLLLHSYAKLKENPQELPLQVREVRLREVLERIVKLYESWGNPENAANWRALLSTSDAMP